ncbi:MAG: EAL domain-containing protein [Alphaproteobacteria bacterium]|nr:EAL domain-containing protein [Alphaproteobacteria bacterium]
MSRELETPPPDWIARFVAELPVGIALFDRELRYVAASAAWLNAFGICAEPLVGRRHGELRHCSGPVLGELQQRALAGESVEGCESAEQDAAGRWRRWVAGARPWREMDGALIGVIASIQELDALATETSLQRAPDALTGLAGRYGFTQRIAEVLADPAPARRAAAMFILDLDHFKGVNDLHGVRVGDNVLKIIANRLVSGTRSRPILEEAGDTGRSRELDMVARLGADEFGIVLGSPTPNLADADAFARRLLQLVHNPIICGSVCIRLTASIGYIITSPAHRTEDDALRDLDIALQEAKARGPNKSVAWEPSLTSTVGRRLFLLDQLRRALDENEFVLHYQPILRLEDGKVVGAEALLRWNHPTDGLVSPAAFLPVLEETGLIVAVGCWVIREVVRQMQVWQLLYGRDIIDWVSVNVSARQFNDPSLLLSTLSEINDSGFPLDRLKVEITESAVMRNAEVTRTALTELQDLGIRIAIDDFGTGYSSLSTLRHYSVDTIKIDAGFTSRLDTADGMELVMALLMIARIYGAEIVAEGIETTSQRDVLRASGCGFGQGYLFARPMDGRSFGAYALTHLVERAEGGDTEWPNDPAGFDHDPTPQAYEATGS